MLDKRMTKILRLFAMTACVLFALKGMAGTIIPNEFWICDRTNTENLGTMDNPYDGSARVKFDEIMSKMPPIATIHILPGTYETWGEHDWQMTPGEKILGSGRDNTVLQFPAGTPQGVVGNAVISGPGPLTNAEIADLTLDCNWHGGGYTYSGISIDGTGDIVRRVRVIHCGNTQGVNSEAFGISLGSGSVSNSQGNIIEDCEVSEFSGGPGISAIGIGGCGTNYMSGIVRNNVVLLPASSSVNAFGINGNWVSDGLIEGNYVYGALNAVYSDVGGWTNTVIMNNTFKNCFNGVAIGPANNPLKNLTIAFNKIDLVATNNYPAVAFDFWGGDWTNIFIFGNTVDFYNGGSSPGVLIAASDVTGLVLDHNFIDATLASNQLTTTYFTNVSNFAIDNNYDLFGNYLDDLNVPMLGGVAVSPFGLTLINSAGASTALATLGLPSNSPTVVTNHETGITLNGTFSGYGGGLTGLNWSDIIGTPAFVQYSDPAPTFANGMSIGAGTAYRIGGGNVLWCSNFNAGNLVVGYQSPAVIPNGIQNTVVGPSAMANSTNANGNTIIGTSAGRNLLSSTYNTMVGDNAGYVLKHGDDNTFVGSMSGYGNGSFTNGYQNTLIGDSSLYRARNGTNNVALGYMAGSWLYSGNNNVFIAHQGTSAETNSNGTIYIGDPGVHNTTYIAGTVHASTGFAGNGSGLTNIPASSLAGTVNASSLPFYIRSGTANFAGAASEVSVHFSAPVPDTNYVVTFGSESNEGTMTNTWYNSKTTNGFQIQRAGGSLNSLAFDYIVVQKQ
jgi:hypothetical protein